MMVIIYVIPVNMVLEVKTLGIKDSFNPMYSVKGLLRLYQHLQEQSIHLILLHQVISIIFLIISSLMMKELKVVAHMHV